MSWLKEKLVAAVAPQRVSVSGQIGRMAVSAVTAAGVAVVVALPAIGEAVCAAHREERQAQPAALLADVLPPALSAATQTGDPVPSRTVDRSIAVGATHIALTSHALGL